MLFRSWSAGDCWLVCVLSLLSALPAGQHGIAQAQAPSTDPFEALPPQTILPPGLFLFQTRTRDGNCEDAPRTGYVTSAVATLDGVPGARTMTMNLLNSKYWPGWKLHVLEDDTIVGTANMFGVADGSKGSTRFEIRSKKDRFQGVGSRTYPHAKRPGERCTLNYDALLKPLD